MNARTLTVAAATLMALTLALAARDGCERPTYRSTEDQARLDACLALSTAHMDEVKTFEATCSPLLPTINCRRAFAAALAGEVKTGQAALACRASVCDEWTTAYAFCQHPKQLISRRELARLSLHSASAALGRALSEAELAEGMRLHEDTACMADELLQGTARYAEAWSLHLRETAVLSGHFMRLFGLHDLLPEAEDPDPIRCGLDSVKGRTRAAQPPTIKPLATP